MNVLIWGDRIAQLGNEESVSAEAVALVQDGAQWKLKSDQELVLDAQAYVIVMQVAKAALLMDGAVTDLTQGTAYQLTLGKEAALVALEPSAVLNI